ncbi:MAG: Pol4 [Clostridia bacterium]|nr:Pol4 [Clostridia bacterium]
MRYAKEKGVKLSINTDAHTVQGLQNIKLGIGIARKGWQERADVFNTMSLQEMERCLKDWKI